MTEAQFWDRLAEKYAAQPVKDGAAFDRKKVITRQHLHPDSSVVEFGCGTGSLALELSSHAGQVHAIDVSAEMIRIAERKKVDHGVTNVTFHTGTLEAMRPRIPAEVDAVWAFSILHLVDDRTSTLKTAFELLKPGGVFISSNVCLAGTWVPHPHDDHGDALAREGAARVLLRSQDDPGRDRGGGLRRRRGARRRCRRPGGVRRREKA